MKTKTLNILSIFLLILSIAGVIIPRDLNDLDEIWNYNFARCVADGLLPYKDFNMVQTPLLPIICGLILKLSFNELIVMRILAVFLMTLIFIIIYKILNILKINKYFIAFFIIWLFIILRNYFCIDYNFSILLITLTTIYYELKYLENKNIFEPNFKYDFFLGILVATSILFKHTTGLAVTLVCIFYKLLLSSSKEDFKKVFKIIVTRIFGAIIPITILLIYLIANNIVYDFLDYTIYSIKTFSNKISYMFLLNGTYGLNIQILSYLVPVTILFMYYISVYKANKTNEQKNIFVLFSYSVASFVVVYPISDGIHFLIGALPGIISIYYLIFIAIKHYKLNNEEYVLLKHFFQCFCVLISLLIIFNASKALLNYTKTMNENTEIKHFKYIPVHGNDIVKLGNFILEQNKIGKNVYILDASAAIYMIPIDKYNKDFDLFLKGNLGSDGEERTNREA